MENVGKRLYFWTESPLAVRAWVWMDCAWQRDVNLSASCCGAGSFGGWLARRREGISFFLQRHKDTRDLSFRELLILPKRSVFKPLFFFFVTCIHDMDGMDMIYWLMFDVTLYWRLCTVFIFCSCREIVTFLKYLNIYFSCFYCLFDQYSILCIFFLNKISQRCVNWCAIDWPTHPLQIILNFKHIYLENITDFF